MKAWTVLGQARTADGNELRLQVRDDEHLILVDGQPLMSSRVHGSEEELARVGCRHLRETSRPHVLVGGLGMGFTLRAALDVLPPEAIVTVAEFVPAVVDWNRGALASLAGYPLADPRVRVEAEDVLATLRANRAQFDAILLDVDNGPEMFTVESNRTLYDDGGVAAASSALRIGGVLAIWSARDDRRFVLRLRSHGFTTEVVRVRARGDKGGARQIIFLGVKPGTVSS